MQTLARAARAASRTVATLDSGAKNAVLMNLADAIVAERDALLDANRADMDAARAAELPEAKLRRLDLTDSSLAQMAVGLRQVALMPDPVGAVTRDETTQGGLHVRKVRAPLGVVAMIYEARPGVTIDAFALCFKAGNACILKGGREAARSNQALAAIIHRILAERGVPAEAATVIVSSDREDMKSLLAQSDSIDLVIPRGGAELIEFVHQHSRIPTIQHFHGVCHIYIDAAADLEQAVEICVTAKTSAPATCNAVECVLVHESVAEQVAPRLVERFTAEGVEVRGDDAVRTLAPGASAASPEDWGREFLDLIVAMRIVADLDAAVQHIQRYGSNHTDAILSRDQASQREFVERVQSSCVLVNASTRFNDGFQLGLGAEIGISTSRIHAYGPMGLEELTTQRYVVEGSGQTR